MNSRERTRIALDHQQPDRVPLMMWITPEVSGRLKNHFNVNSDEESFDEMDIDVRWIHPDYIGPKLKIFEDGSSENEFGIRTKRVVNEFGSYDEFVFHPLASAQTVEDIENFHWPDPDWWDYDGMNKKIAWADRVQPRWLAVGYGQLFERGWSLMGFEKMLYEIAMNPKIVEAVFDHLFDYYLAQTGKMLEAAEGRIDMVYTSDDLASQESLLISPGMFRKFLKNRWKKFNNTIKSRFGNHIKIHYHSCGAIAELIPDLIETGIDILNPIQPMAKGMEPEKLKHNYGDRLSFSGGFDIQQILPHGSPEEVRSEARRLVSILGKNGGYIASAAHAVQADTSVENVLAMVEGFKTR